MTEIEAQETVKLGTGAVGQISASQASHVVIVIAFAA
jgi:hypothetical protein